MKAALEFYAEHKNWNTPSEGAEAIHDPEPSPTDRDRGERARQELEK